MCFVARFAAGTDDPSIGDFMIASTFKHRLIAFAIAAACVPAAFAQTPPSPPSVPNAAPPAGRPMGGPMDHRDPMHGGHMMRELARLKTSLKLDANQTQLWDRAESMMKPSADLHEQMKARHDRMAAMLDDPNFDPKKLAADMDSTQAERAAKMKGMRDAWIAVYQGLNPVQRGQVREFLRSRMMKGPRMHGPMGGWHQDGMPGRDGAGPKH
jgi:periplasmic protein CpxP/Spy